MNLPSGMPNHYAQTIFWQKIQPEILDTKKKRTWSQHARFVTKHVMGAVGVTMQDSLAKYIAHAITKFKIVPGGRYLYAAGRPFHQVNNCMLLRAYDSREGWSKLSHDASMSLMSGAGLGIAYGNIRGRGVRIKKTGGFATGSVSLMQIINELGRFIQQGGSRRSAIWAGLPWNHMDIMEFVHAKDWPELLRREKERNFNFPCPLDGTNISVQLDDSFFSAYDDNDDPQYALAHMVYWETIKRMLKSGEPGFSVDAKNHSGEDLRNACTELTSSDDGDVCNLLSINLARVDSLSEFNHLMEIGLAFQVAGTVYSDVPYPYVDQIRTKNRRLGLGLMGIHEWLLTHGKPYGPDDELQSYLEAYSRSTEIAWKFCDEWSLSRCVKTRAIAPNGTIAGYAGTTGSIEPIYSVALKRRYLKGDVWNYQYIVDPTAKRLIDGGIKPEAIEDAYDLAENVERRIAFQSWIQKYVDHGISSTINLPAWGHVSNNEATVESFGNTLMKYLPTLRGITCYPDGARGGQPLTPVKYSTAIKHIGEEFTEEGVDVCELTGKSSCG